MKTLLSFLAVASSLGTLMIAATPASAEYYSPLTRQSSYSYTPSQSNIRYNVYAPTRSNNDFNSGYSSVRSSSRGFGHSSGSYFGW